MHNNETQSQNPTDPPYRTLTDAADAADILESVQTTGAPALTDAELQMLDAVRQFLVEEVKADA